MKSSGKPILRLGFTDTFGAIEEFFTETLSTEFEIVRDDENPDYLIFGDRNFGENNLRYDETSVLRFFTRERTRGLTIIDAITLLASITMIMAVTIGYPFM